MGVLTAITYTATTVLILVGIGIGAFFRFGPGKILGALGDAMLGSPQIRDRRGEVLDPGSPGLVHRVAQVEEAVVEFRHMVGLLTETQKRLDQHDAAINALIAGSLERAATAMSSAEMLRLVNDRDVLDVDPE